MTRALHTDSTPTDRSTELRHAHSCMALGAGLGALGTGTALVAGASCPLCVVIAPALFGYGFWKRMTLERETGRESVTNASTRAKSESER